MSDIITEITVKNMAREMVKRATVKNTKMMYIVRDGNGNWVASLPETVSEDILNRWIRRGFKVALIDADKMK